ncbi:MAG: cbb3-type cytochrome c oxidase subunit I, partial [Burkholderiales bacterium]
LFLQLASAHHLLADPGVSTAWKVVNTSYFMYFAVLASMIHGLTIPGAIEVAQRAKGYNNGLFEWLRKAPWGNPVWSGVFISIIGFGFLGGISGVMMGTEQLNMIIHNTVYVPGHFHATVVVGTTLTFMALTFFLIPVLFKREMINPALAKWQPYLFGFSMYFFCLVMMGAGTLGVSRRHWDMSFGGAGMAYEWPGAAYLMMGLVGIAGVAAIAGGAIYIYITVGSLLWGKKLAGGDVSAKFTPIPPTAPTAVAQSYGSAGFAAPGTFALAMVFLVSFILYYFINWKYLSQVWGLS